VKDTIKPVTPMMLQFLKIKEDHTDALLFYRMGDFYELFFEDAIKASKALGITLTKRGKHLGEDIPMCGVPAHSSEGYLLDLIKKGFRVAVCEQMESPIEAKKRGYKAVVKRDVVRLVTPGTLTEESLLEPHSNNYLMAFSEIRNDGAIAWLDISTGELRTTSCPKNMLSLELSRISPSELVLSESHAIELEKTVKEYGISISPLIKNSFESQSAERRLLKHYNVASLESFGVFSRVEISAMGALIDYLDITQKGNLPYLHIPIKEDGAKVLKIDPATRKNLELVKNLNGTREGSLLSIINKTSTSSGARLIERWLSSPSTDLNLIHNRLACLDLFFENKELLDAVRHNMRNVPDIDRSISRLSLDRAGPRELGTIRDGLIKASELSNILQNESIPAFFVNSIKSLTGFSSLILTLNQSLIEHPPHLIKEGGFIKSGFDPDLDECRVLRDNSRKIILELQSKYIAETGINSLKIRYNNVLGYFIEATATHSEKMLSLPLSEFFIHRQTTANSIRFTTVELSELETSILNSANKISGLEKTIFSNLQNLILIKTAELNDMASTLAKIDVFTSLAKLAINLNWVKPSLDLSRDFQITDGRHPVVESAISGISGEAFISNSCNLSAELNDANIWLLTGPNMSGKSTFLRQNALIAILSQIGSYVPASSAKIGLFSQVFSRVGASDDLARGRSTFMVEMVETAAILNQADNRALVILDEIGRGTATYDGLSIAWATLEHLHNVSGCRALFATHYHELTALSSELPGVQNATVSVKEWGGEIIFLHSVIKGSADRSYGVQVAKLAGLPRSVIFRAKEILSHLESSSYKRETTESLPLFSQKNYSILKDKTKDKTTQFLDKIEPDNLSPKEALQLLYKLKEISGS